ncbi:MAG: M20/M25/M40 family metallo-hydrolase, partial [Planctomycetota bacterium]|nr:M20/M25/M40 family metallo-hydrolase [Planctomycetota bacterium]
MNHSKTLRCLVLLVLAPLAAWAADPAKWAEDHVDQLVPIYQHLHANPELSLHEVETARLVAKELRAAGAAVTTGIGGHGLVGVLENGDGKRLLIRTDLDALPIVEETGLPYASRVRTENPEGDGTVGVMHACGHDLHMTNLIGVARYLAENRDRWRGT